MSLKALTAVKSAGLLPVFVYALLAALLLGCATGSYVAWKLTAGMQALQQNAQLRADAKQWAGIAETQRQNTARQAAELEAAIGRLNTISQGREDDRKTLQNFAAQLDARLTSLGKRNPALRDLDLGADFLRHWNQANAGPSASPAAARPIAKPDATLPAAAAGSQRPATGGAGAARQRSSAVSRLPQRAGPADRSRARVARHGVALVLPERQRRPSASNRVRG